MTFYEDVKHFIETTVLRSQLWDVADEKTQNKAVNNAVSSLRSYYGEKKELTVRAVALQTMWLLAIDDSIQRAEQGVTSISVGGMSISLANIDRSIAPEVLRTLGRRIGRYAVPIEDTFRHRTRPEYANRRY